MTKETFTQAVIILDELNSIEETLSDIVKIEKCGIHEISTAISDYNVVRISKYSSDIFVKSLDLDKIKEGLNKRKEELEKQFEVL